MKDENEKSLIDAAEYAKKVTEILPKVNDETDAYFDRIIKDRRDKAGTRKITRKVKK